MYAGGGGGAASLLRFVKELFVCLGLCAKMVVLLHASCWQEPQGCSSNTGSVAAANGSSCLTYLTGMVTA